MSEVSLRRLLARLAAIALSTTSIAAADPGRPDPATASFEASADSELGAEFDPDLRVDPELIDPPDAAMAIGRGLALAAQRMRPILATQVFSTWATSVDPVRRLAVAHALGWEFALVGDAVMIDHLSRDDDPGIRAAIAHAAWARRLRGGDPGVLDRLRADPVAEVRAIADQAR